MPQKPLVLHLPDYPDRYLADHRRYSFIFLSSQIHWRQISHTTWSFLLQGKTLHRFRRVIQKASINVNDSYLSRNLYGRLHFIHKALCLSPIPGLACHLHHNTLTPHFPWKKLVDQLLSKEIGEA